MELVCDKQKLTILYQCHFQLESITFKLKVDLNIMKM